MIDHVRSFHSVYTKKDDLNACLKGLFKLTFYAAGMLISIKDNRSLIEKVRHGIPFEDYSLA